MEKESFYSKLCPNYFYIKKTIVIFKINNLSKTYFLISLLIYFFKMSYRGIIISNYNHVIILYNLIYFTLNQNIKASFNEV